MRLENDIEGQTTDSNEPQANAAYSTMNFHDIYDEWVVQIYQYCLYKTHDVQTAEDLTQQVFLKVYERFPAYRDDGKIAAWIFTIARNHIFDHFRKINRRSKQ